MNSCFVEERLEEPCLLRLLSHFFAPEEVDEECQGVEEEGVEHPGEGETCPKRVVPVPDQFYERLQVRPDVHPVEDDVEEDVGENLLHL